MKKHVSTHTSIEHHQPTARLFQIQSYKMMGKRKLPISKYIYILYIVQSDKQTTCINLQLRPATHIFGVGHDLLKVNHIHLLSRRGSKTWGKTVQQKQQKQPCLSCSMSNLTCFIMIFEHPENQYFKPNISTPFAQQDSGSPRREDTMVRAPVSPLNSTKLVGKPMAPSSCTSEVSTL